MVTATPREARREITATVMEGMSTMVEVVDASLFAWKDGDLLKLTVRESFGPLGLHEGFAKLDCFMHSARKPCHPRGGNGGKESEVVFGKSRSKMAATFPST